MSAQVTVRVEDLKPGMLVRQAGREAVFIAQSQHPLWPTLQLVIWRLLDDGLPGEWSFDALRAIQEVGEADPEESDAQRRSRLHRVLLTGNPR